MYRCDLAFHLTLGMDVLTVPWLINTPRVVTQTRDRAL